ncbi:hypothetical protein D3C87_1889180 [compost metagenome]
MLDIAVDEPRITNHATAHFISHQALGLTFEQRHAEQRLDFMQGFRSAGLGDRNMLGGLVQRAAIIEGYQQAQLFEAQT